MSAEGEAPLIVTARLPRDLHARYTALRKAHFPAERNYLEAHVTLFHALPAMCEAEACTYLRRLAAEFAPIDGHVEGIMSLGRGTAVKLISADMLLLRELIADHFHGLLTQQDQHRPADQRNDIGDVEQRLPHGALVPLRLLHAGTACVRTLAPFTPKK